jgi:hypothetical protein
MLREVLRIRRNGQRGIYHRVRDPISGEILAD